MSRGLVIGKFYPPHAGHHYLIDEAEKGCDELMVMVLFSVYESITSFERVRWLKERHPNVLVVSAQDENPIDYSDEGWRPHIEIMGDTLMQWGHKPDVVFSSEKYGDELAQRLGDQIGHNVHHQMVDESRSKVNISGTAFRKDASKHWEFLSPATKASLAMRVVVCGAESTGTTTLAKALAEHYKTSVAPEYGRYFDWGVGKNHTWITDDFVHIAHEQERWIDRMARYSNNGLMIADTDAFATAMFHEVYLGFQEYDILDYAVQHGNHLYLITDHVGVKFEDDGTRMNSGKREWMTKWFEEFIPGPADRRVLISGSRSARLKAAVQAIDNIIGSHHHYHDPIGEAVNA